MAAGESWLGQFELPHRLSNGLGTPRVHLIVDLWPRAKALDLALPAPFVTQPGLGSNVVHGHDDAAWSEVRRAFLIHHYYAATPSPALRCNSCARVRLAQR